MINNIGIIGIGAYVPEKVLTNTDIELMNNGTNGNWTKENLGIENRNISPDNIFSSDLAYMASVNALNDANINAKEIDMIILSTSSPDRISPSTACILAEKLKVNCPALDINAVCCGFIYGLQLASGLVKSGIYKKILLVASETYSKITDWNDRNCVFFGDGAGAVIISNVEGSWISTDIFSDGKGKENFSCHHGEKFQMNGRAVYDFGTKILPITIKNSLEKNSVAINDVSWIIPHQPSKNILIKTADMLNIPIEKFVLNMKDNANTASASIPMALNKIYKDGKLNNGDILVMPAIGSGWAWGVSILKYYRL